MKKYLLTAIALFSISQPIFSERIALTDLTPEKLMELKRAYPDVQFTVAEPSTLDLLMGGIFFIYGTALVTDGFDQLYKFYTDKPATQLQRREWLLNGHLKSISGSLLLAAVGCSVYRAITASK